MSWGKLSYAGIVLGEMSRGQLSKVVIIDGAIILGGNCPGGNCPRWQLSVGQLSRGELACFQVSYGKNCSFLWSNDINILCTLDIGTSS